MAIDTLTVREAYVAMFVFLERQYERTGRPDDLGSLLGGMSTLEDGGTADPAEWFAWLDAVRTAREGGEALTRMRLARD